MKLTVQKFADKKIVCVARKIVEDIEPQKVQAIVSYTVDFTPMKDEPWSPVREVPEQQADRSGTRNGLRDQRPDARSGKRAADTNHRADHYAGHLDTGKYLELELAFEERLLQDAQAGDHKIQRQHAEDGNKARLMVEGGDPGRSGQKNQRGQSAESNVDPEDRRQQIFRCVPALNHCRRRSQIFEEVDEADHQGRHAKQSEVGWGKQPRQNNHGQ